MRRNTISIIALILASLVRTVGTGGYAGTGFRPRFSIRTRNYEL